MRLARTAALFALLAVGALMLAPALLGLERYVIEGGSMGEALPRGSVAYEEVVPASRIGVGDVITYRPPGQGRLVTHRVVSASGGVLRTRGDANSAIDPGRFRLRGPRQARLVFHVPLAGYAVAALSVRWVRMLALGVPALAIALCSFRRAVRPVREPISRAGRACA